MPTRVPLPGQARARRVLERNVLQYRRTWWVLLSGFFEPVFYLLGLGFGLEHVVGDIGGIPTPCSWPRRSWRPLP
ncbi:MAG: hypothetical protein R3C32_12390 [Chloroflexota bacterium]